MASRRLPLAVVLAATALALVAALGVVAVLDGGGAEGAGDSDGGPAAGGTSDGYELSPAGELPASVAEVRLGSLEGGDDRALGELIGSRPVVVNFFASWCVPCIDEMPAFERVHRSLAGQVSFVGMANRDAFEDALATVETTGVTYPTFDDPDASALTYFGGLTMPTTVFIDAAGEVVDVNSGPLTEDELRARITDLFGVPA
ncbi:MAG TPA: TlpA disulfide reductase family protein [Acidimicrobiales bacterium]|nr:TlpA disulfide reductase family protein [Acidimicrobiales bacterium]